MEEKLVSVIVPVYNVEKYLSTCLESILTQSYTKLEILLVDDGSTDNSSQICIKYESKDDRIKVLKKKNGGLAAARNTGIANAHGKYIYFVDSDDCIHPELIYTTVSLAEQYNANIVQVELKMVPADFQNYSQKAVKGKIQCFTKEEALCNLDQDNQTIAQNIRLSTTVVWNKLYRATIFEQIKFQDKLRIHEDQMIIHRLIAEANGMIFYDTPLYYYRNNQNSLIRTSWRPEKLIIIDCYRDRLDCALELEESETKKDVVSLFYNRYLICMIKNYIMIYEHMKGKERKKMQKELIIRLKKELKNETCTIPFKRKIALQVFVFFPMPSILLYKILKHDNK